MKNKFRLGFIGCGEMSVDMARVCRFNRHIAITACADTNGERLRSFAERFGAPAAFSDYREMLDAAPIDAVYLCLPHHLHYPVMREIIKRGVNVLCEKPLAVNMEHARGLCDLAERGGIKLGVNYQYRYDAACYRLATAARSGALGELRYGRSNVPWFRSERYFDWGPWRGVKEQAGGGTLITQASHTLDILLWAFGSRPVWAEGAGAKRKFTAVEVEDTAMGIVGLESGALLGVTGSMAAEPEQRVTIEIYGSKGTGHYRGPDYPPFSRTRFEGVRVKKESPPVRGIFSFSRSIEAFRRWVMEGYPYLCTARDSLPALAVTLAIYRSFESGAREAVELPQG